MALPNELHPLQLGAGSVSSYQIEQSLRFNGSDSAYLINSTPSTDGNRKTYTISVWVKKVVDSGTGGDTFFFATADSNYAFTSLSFGDGGAGHSESLRLLASDSGASQYKVRESSTAAYRDYSAWMHVVAVMDTTQSTAANRAKIYVNGEQITDLGSAYTEPVQDYQNYVNGNNAKVHIGRNYNEAGQGPWYFDGYLAEYHLVDGTALDPTDFGEYDVSGVWRPIEYTGTYGTNGFYLKFDPSAANGIGHDHSGNGNNFTATGFVTTGAGTDVMDDTPTTNWSTLNPLRPSGYGTLSLSDGNLNASRSTTSYGAITTTIGVSSGKWYWEVYCNSIGFVTSIGITNNLAANGPTATGAYLYHYDGKKYVNGSLQNYSGNSYTNGDLLGFALDMDAGTLVAYKNGTSQGTLQTGLSGTFYPYVTLYGTHNVTFNFGQREFDYPPGTTSATDYFNTVTYTGNGSTQSITGVGFQPDFVWVKARSASGHHVLSDAVRGANKQLWSNRTAGDQTSTLFITSFDSDGFSVGDSSAGYGNVNTNNDTFVAWCWKAGGTASANTDGTISSSVSANNDAGFSVVTYTGNGTSGATVGHGLSAAPSVIFVKLRETATDGNNKDWAVYHSSVDASAPEDYNLVLNSNAARSDSTGSWNDTAPTSSVFTVGNNFTVNNNGKDYVAYCWTDTEGVVKTGSYTGTAQILNFVDVGFKPAMVIVKRTDSTGTWTIKDTARGGEFLYAESNQTADSISASSSRFTNTGFYLDSYNNVSGGTYVYIAFAESFSADEDYKDLNTANLSAPTIKDGSDYFNTVLYTGSVTDTSTQAVTGVGFQSDWTWIKRRDGANSHQLVDAVRGTGKWLESNSTSAENSTNTNGVLTSFDADGFTLTGGSTNANLCCEDGFTYASWNWKANGSGSSNTDGTITSTVSANPSAGFSIVQFDGTGANGSIGHGLGVAPSFIVAKSKTHTDNWFVYHSAIGANGYIMLNQTAAVDSPNSTVWQNVSPTSTVFYASTGGYNDSGQTIIAYCFAEVEGYSKFGSYTGNGSTDGPFVYCGFSPAWIMIKRTDSGNNWVIIDSARDTYNVAYRDLYADDSVAEYSGTARPYDFVSNGFKIRGGVGRANTSGGTYIFAAFAENPFGGDGVSPATAR